MLWPLAHQRQSLLRHMTSLPLKSVAPQAPPPPHTSQPPLQALKLPLPTLTPRVPSSLCHTPVALWLLQVIALLLSMLHQFNATALTTASAQRAWLSKPSGSARQWTTPDATSQPQLTVHQPIVDPQFAATGTVTTKSSFPPRPSRLCTLARIHQLISPVLSALSKLLVDHRSLAYKQQPPVLLANRQVWCSLPVKPTQ